MFILKASENIQKTIELKLNKVKNLPPIISDSSVFIRLVEIDDWVRVLIEVDEDTTSDDLRKAVPLALLWRDKLLELQGIWMKGGNNPFLEVLSLEQNAGESYTNIANRINKRIESLLIEHENYLNDLEANKIKFKTMFDLYLWKSHFNQFSLSHARDLLKALKLKNSEIDEILKFGLENIRMGKPAFEKEYPVSRDKIISTMKTWRKGKKHKIIQEKFIEND